VLGERGHEYDNLAPVNYHPVLAACGSKVWLTAKASKIAELEDVISKVVKHDAAAYIEVMIP
jgi:indolepyruvate decarboxylase